MITQKKKKKQRKYDESNTDFLERNNEKFREEIEYREGYLWGVSSFVYFEGRQRLQNSVATVQEGTMCVGYKRRRPGLKVNLC